MRPPRGEGDAGGGKYFRHQRGGDCGSCPSSKGCLGKEGENRRHLPPVLVFAADLRSSGRVALRVLYEPSTSISMTDLKAFGLSWLMGARKLPAAPALRIVITDPHLIAILAFAWESLRLIQRTSKTYIT